MNWAPCGLLASYHFRTSLVPIHRLRLVCDLTDETVLLMICCVTCPRLFLAGFISLHWMLLGKLGLWSFIEIKAFLSAIFSSLSPSCRLMACCWVSLLMLFSGYHPSCGNLWWCYCWGVDCIAPFPRFSCFICFYDNIVALFDFVFKYAQAG